MEIYCYNDTRFCRFLFSFYINVIMKPQKIKFGIINQYSLLDLGIVFILKYFRVTIIFIV